MPDRELMRYSPAHPIALRALAQEEKRKAKSSVNGPILTIEFVTDPKPASPLKGLPRLSAPKMNKTEQRYADILDGLKRMGIVRRWEFEGIRMKLADGAFYRPDFLVWKCDDTMECIEIKGSFIREASLVRYKVARDSYPIFKFKMLQYTRKKGWEEIL